MMQVSLFRDHVINANGKGFVVRIERARNDAGMARAALVQSAKITAVQCQYNTVLLDSQIKHFRVTDALAGLAEFLHC